MCPGSTNRSGVFICAEIYRRRGGNLNAKEQINASSASNGIKTFFSAGEIFADGAMIELVSGAPGLNKPDVLLWNGKRRRLEPPSNTAVALTKYLNWIRVYTGQCGYLPGAALRFSPCPVCRHRRFV